MVGLNGHLSLVQQECQLLLFDCFLDCVSMSLKSDAGAIETALCCAERSAVLRTSEVVQWGFTH